MINARKNGRQGIKNATIARFSLQRKRALFGMQVQWGKKKFKTNGIFRVSVLPCDAFSVLCDAVRKAHDREGALGDPHGMLDVMRRVAQP
jgi:hypothetical protein